jgi:arginase
VTGYRLIVVPYELGRLRNGVGNGPERLLAAGAEPALAVAGAPVRREHVELDARFNQTGRGEVDACFELIGQVAERVRAAVEEGAFPVVLSGSCFAAVGVVAGLAESDPAVVWFDAHSDFNSPDTSISGYFDGMGLAVLTGGAWQAMHARVPGARPVPESAVILAGARDFDPPEVLRLESAAVTHLPPRELGGLAGALAAISARAERRLLHVDLDVLDSDEARVNVYSAAGGPSGTELADLVGTVCRESPVRALSLTAYDPGFDPDGRVPPIALDLLRVVAEMHRGLGAV